MRRFVVVILLCLIEGSVFAQWDKNLTYSLYGGYGYVFRTNDFMRGDNVDNKDITSIKNFAIEVSKDVDGSKDWHQLYKNFHYGVGLFHGVFNYSKNIGNPWGLYGIIGFTPIDKVKWQMKTDIALGFSGIWDGFSQEDNPYNVAVSTPIECYAQARLSFHYNITDNWHLGLSGAFTHFSNGCIKRPNKGINIFNPTITLAYNPKNITRTRIPDFEPKFEKNFQRIVSFYAGVKGMYWDGYCSEGDRVDLSRDTIRNVYSVFGLQYREMFALTMSQGLGWGMDLSYNDVIKRNKGWHHFQPKYDQGFDLTRFTFSIFASYEYSINRLSITMEPGIYIYKPQFTYFSRLYQRIGLRYNVFDNMFVQMSLRAYHFTKADYIEWGVGYRFKYKM